ncbi:PREDICTED: uncharacterized protein LOC104814493 [Tarenaya hassleriana]|uniref:uncharacterized protein LOC104814493 n=1 Tax=Tarenaya hassleriana TaxID=28532 RepID=UPI00053C7A7E|nr:PREDICTED: uncharacterized protein LOC104814493 [Tarenaya hassleriana]
MVNRRFAQVSTSDEEGDAPLTRHKGGNSGFDETKRRQRKQKKVKLSEDEDEDEDEGGVQIRGTKRKRKIKGRRDEHESEEEEVAEEEDEEEEKPEDAKPVGKLVKVTGKGRGKRNHYAGFEYDGNKYELEDPVLLVPEDKNLKPYVAIIKDITQSNGNMMILGQWFYRPEEAEKKGGGNWQPCDTRELFYSFHRDEVPAESAMHKCVVHFVPAHKQLPNRKQHPGFIVRKVYDTVERKLWKLTDTDYEDTKQGEINLLVDKTMLRLGDLPDLESGEAPVEQEDLLKAKRSLRKKNIPPLDVRKEEDAFLKAETPGSATVISEEYRSILEKFDSLTGDNHRDKGLEKLLQAVQHVCFIPESKQACDEKTELDGFHHENDEKAFEAEIGSQKDPSKAENTFLWPDDAVPAVCALEQASHDSLASDFQKYNQKLRSLVFNLKNTPLLARRLLSGDLKPTKILNMSPTELKEGLTAEETATKEPDDTERMQMTDARCSRCSQFKVGLRDIIQAGHADRYQLECIACGHSWYASRDEASALTIDAPNNAKSVGMEPLATAKFGNVEKCLASPREKEKPADDPLRKASKPFIPTLDTKKSNIGTGKPFTKSHASGNPETGNET